jgi:predicted ATPase
VVVLGSLFGLGLPTVHPRTPAQLREQTLTLLAGQILALTATGPLCLVVEDLHWLDATSVELLGRLAAAAADRRLLLLLATRDGFAPSWPSAAVTRVPLARLAAEETAGMVSFLFGQRKLPPWLLRRIVLRSDGVPLFVEEVVRTVLVPDSKAGAADIAEATEARIPASLHDSLMARLDRSGVAKEIAQVASVIGRSVRHDILAAVASLPVEQLREPLATLAAAGVMVRDDKAASGTSTFTHALLRDAAYDSLLREQRRALHLRVAHALQVLDPGAVEQQPELLALHLTDAEQAAAAAPFWREAARRNLERHRRAAAGADGAARAGADRAGGAGLGRGASSVRHRHGAVPGAARLTRAFPHLLGLVANRAGFPRAHRARRRHAGSRRAARRCRAVAAGASLQLGQPLLRRPPAGVLRAHRRRAGDLRRARFPPASLALRQP